METSPSESGETQGRTPCPECGSTRGYAWMGEFRVQCLGCNSLLKVTEVGMESTNEEQ